MEQVIICATGLSIATLIGAVLGFCIKALPHKWNDTVMGFCAGVMLSASVLGLIVPSMDMTQHIWLPFLGVLTGAVFLNFIDFVTPHLHKITGLELEQHSNNSSIDKVLLFVLAIAIHKLPEGMATGVGFNNTENIHGAWSVAFGIALQNIPEGMVVISPLLLLGVSKTRTFLISVVICILELIGVFLGYFLGSISMYFLPFMLSFAGGAMLYVVSDEMIPETHAHGYQKQATFALLIGFMIVIIMEKIV
ncbi:MAG: ZIP family metal transporter [Bacteroidales bacterium]|nr:ZIP family metal transporter [Bacteroidales bacterium]